MLHVSHSWEGRENTGSSIENAESGRSFNTSQITLFREGEISMKGPLWK